MEEVEIVPKNEKHKLFRVKLDVCLFCGKPKTNDHHAIPQALKPLYNVVIPLCDDHKNTLHPLIKQVYVPKELRDNIGTIIKLSDNLQASVQSLRNKTDFIKSKIKTTRVTLQSPIK